MEIGNKMMAGVELVSSCFYGAVDALSTQSFLNFGANFSIPMTKTFK